MRWKADVGVETVGRQWDIEGDEWTVAAGRLPTIPASRGGDDGKA